MTLLITLLAAVGVAVFSHAHWGDGVLGEVGDSSPVLALAAWLALVNGGLLIFNLVPAFPLDGGRIARAITWKLTGDRNRATRLAGRLGQGFAYILVGSACPAGLVRSRQRHLAGHPPGGFSARARAAQVVSSQFAERIEAVTAAPT